MEQVRTNRTYRFLRADDRSPVPPGLVKTRRERAKTDFSRIRCPLCGWRPRKTDRWSCSRCDVPEGFTGGCGTSWNTFQTHGLCPGCRHPWQWTCCLACAGWSLHEDWYDADSQGTPGTG
ncbi:MAG TPA: hypothetical protein PLP29_15910 [Candidatus Ozemobacteraceae bacterium]|nr:hypothetical protein [Candidatus Ozemobacteraceae bacterium]